MKHFYPPLSLRDISPTGGESAFAFVSNFLTNLLLLLSPLVGEMSDRTEGGIS
jgi:hypothetical protein